MKAKLKLEVECDKEDVISISEKDKILSYIEKLFIQLENLFNSENDSGYKYKKYFETRKEIFYANTQESIQ